MGKGATRTWLLLTLLLKGIFAGEWSVHLPPDPICAVTGSSVVLPCSYDYPHNSSQTSREEDLVTEKSAEDGGEKQQQNKVLSEMWCREESRCITERYVFHSAGISPDPSFQHRVEYLGKPGTKNCSLRISELRGLDSGTYVFYVITSHPTQKMPGQRGVQLLVADSPTSISVSASPSGTVTDGGTLRLACCSPAAGPNSLFRWYQGNGTPVHEGQVWTMDRVSSGASGSYYCQVQTGDNGQNSTSLTVDVQHAPRNTSVIQTPAEELPVTLSCSSVANPPVKTYVWYRGSACPSEAVSGFYPGREFQGAPAGTGPTLSVDEYGTYCCLATNRHGAEMHTVMLSDPSGMKYLIIGLCAAVAVVLVALAAFYLRRRKRSSSHQEYSLAETRPTAL